jgi:hypothetical protein
LNGVFKEEIVNRQQISVLLALKDLGITQRVESFDDRLSIQKSIYLAQAAGANLGHHFAWYLRGPYSRDLARDVLDALQCDDLATETVGWELDDATRAKLSTLRAALEPPATLPKPSWLELLASVHFLIDRKQVPSMDSAAIETRLRKYDKTFPEVQVQEALSWLDRLGLVSTRVA